jgi:hypothetical protein
MTSLAYPPVAGFIRITNNTRYFIFKHNNTEYMFQNKHLDTSDSRSFIFCSILHETHQNHWVKQITQQNENTYKLTYSNNGPLKNVEGAENVLILNMNDKIGHKIVREILNSWCTVLNNTHRPKLGGFAPNIRF